MQTCKLKIRSVLSLSLNVDFALFSFDLIPISVKLIAFFDYVKVDTIPFSPLFFVKTIALYLWKTNFNLFVFVPNPFTFNSFTRFGSIPYNLVGDIITLLLHDNRDLMIDTKRCKKPNRFLVFKVDIV